MSKTHRHILFTIEPVKPRNRVAMDGLKRRGGPHVKPYGSLRQNNKQALRHMLDEDDDYASREALHETMEAKHA